MTSKATLPKCERIRKRAEFLTVQGRGRKLHTDNFLVFVLRREPRAAARFGATVSKKVGGAVVRNRVKRLLREAWRRHKARFSTALDLVWVAKHSAATVAFAEVQREMERLGRRLSG